MQFDAISTAHVIKRLDRVLGYGRIEVRFVDRGKVFPIDIPAIGSARSQYVADRMASSGASSRRPALSPDLLHLLEIGRDVAQPSRRRRRNGNCCIVARFDIDADVHRKSLRRVARNASV